VQGIGGRPRLVVTADGAGIVSHAGTALLHGLADRVGLTGWVDEELGILGGVRGGGRCAEAARGLGVVAGDVRTGVRPVQQRWQAIWQPAMAARIPASSSVPATAVPGPLQHGDHGSSPAPDDRPLRARGPDAHQRNRSHRRAGPSPATTDPGAPRPPQRNSSWTLRVDRAHTGQPV